MLERLFLVHLPSKLIHILQLNIRFVFFIEYLGHLAGLNLVPLGIIPTSPFFTLAGGHLIQAATLTITLTLFSCDTLSLGFGILFVSKESLAFPVICIQV